MKDVTIPGGTAKLRDEGDLTPRQKKALKDAAFAVGPVYQRLRAQGTERALQESSLSATDLRRIRELKEATVCALLDSWSLDAPLPTESTIADLETELYDALVALIEAEPDNTATDFSVNPDPKAPTSGADGSSGTSSDEAPSPSQESSPSDGSPSATDSSSPE
ncbi:MAG TPA: hypothetical protein VNG12_18470 [Acidimicrobiales bacterium]|nr:hypothetical protein [Acidimicrobiales bacterium]